MPRLPLQTLPAFRVVARLGNLRAAAAELHLTHSAVSQQIRLLEEQVGFELFDRRGRRIVLNTAGAALLQSVEQALDQLDEGLRAATGAAGGEAHRLRITMLPSFAQRWLLPRMGHWRALHPDIGVELHSSYVAEDLQREGFHAAVRQGEGRWRGLQADRLFDSPWIAVGSPATAKRLLGRPVQAYAEETLLGHADRWDVWFRLVGVRASANPVAAFNDTGLMLQAAEQGIGIALTRELLAADALRDGKLMRLSSLSFDDDDRGDAYWLAYPPALKAWPPLLAFHEWLLDELDQSQRSMQQTLATATVPARKRAARAKPGISPRRRAK